MSKLLQIYMLKQAQTVGLWLFRVSVVVDSDVRAYVHQTASKETTTIYKTVLYVGIILGISGTINKGSMKNTVMYFKCVLTQTYTSMIGKPSSVV